MADITASPQNSKVVIYFQTGLSDKGAPIIKSRTYSNVEPSATDEDVYEVGQTVGSLMEDPVAHVSRVDINTLITV